MSHRIACVDVPALPLQLLARAHPEWADAPLAVVEEDNPQARILMIDARAAEHRVRPGMRYATALQVSRHLRAAPVPAPELAEAERELLVALQARTPRVEPDDTMPGVYWLDPSGLRGLFGPLEQWAEYVHGALTHLDLVGSVVVGFARLPAWAIARGMRGARVLRSAAEEAELAGRAPLSRLDLDPELRDGLSALGVTRLEGLLRLPRGEIGVRFGPQAAALHARLDDAFRPPMQPAGFDEPIAIEAELDPPTDDAHRLLFCVKGALHALMGELRSRQLALAALTLTFTLERAAAPSERPEHVEQLEPAEATRDELALLELVRLRLAGLSLDAPVERVMLVAEPAARDGAQLALFGGRRRDPGAAGRGIARLRAAFGDMAVSRATLRDAWLPENGYDFEPVSDVRAPAPREAGDGQLVRRLLREPEPLDVGRDGWPRTRPPLTDLTGPYRLQGGWWVREAARDYFFGEREDGALLWLYRDRVRGRWFVHGRID